MGVAKFSRRPDNGLVARLNAIEEARPKPKLTEESVHATVFGVLRYLQIGFTDFEVTVTSKTVIAINKLGVSRVDILKVLPTLRSELELLGRKTYGDKYYPRKVCVYLNGEVICS